MNFFFFGQILLAFLSAINAVPVSQVDQIIHDYDDLLAVESQIDKAPVAIRPPPKDFPGERLVAIAPAPKDFPGERLSGLPTKEESSVGGYYFR